MSGSGAHEEGVEVASAGEGAGVSCGVAVEGACVGGTGVDVFSATAVAVGEGN